MCTGIRLMGNRKLNTGEARPTIQMLYPCRMGLIVKPLVPSIPGSLCGSLWSNFLSYRMRNPMNVLRMDSF